MKKISRYLLALLVLITGNNVFATIRLPAVIGSNMVLQQNAQATLWGWGDPGEKLVITSSWKTAVDSLTVASNGRWKIKIATPAAGGPYTLTLRGWNSITLENVMIGEVWICSGQSNMEMSNTPQIQEELLKSLSRNIRLFHIPRTAAEYPQDNCGGQWDVCNPESLRWFSAVAYFFGKKLQQDLDVPIGLIESAWGGTPVEVWTPAAVIEKDAIMREAAGKLPAVPWGPHQPGVLYNGMIAPVINYTIAGAIWYQGEGNTGIPLSYQRTFTAMIGAWRNKFDTGLPFYYVQIAPFTYGAEYQGALVMEQQTRSLSYPRTGMVVTTDLVDDIKDIHPKNKQDVGLRLANLALAETYGKVSSGYKSPLYKKMEVNKNTITLYFDNAPNGFMTKNNQPATEFLIAGADRVFVPAVAKIEKDRIIVSGKNVINPVAVRFSFSNTGMSNLFSKEGLPVVPFRTDDWEIAPW